MYEHRSKPLLSQRAFFGRLAIHGALAFSLIFSSLLVGMAGYHSFADLNWVDSFLNASMILGGMGPVNPLSTNAAKVFAGLYALYSGLVLIAAIGILAAPIAHRILHRFHLEDASANRK